MSGEEAWRPAAEPPSLEDEQIQIWRVSLQTSPETVARLEQRLAPDEVARANRFRFPRDRRRYIMTRATLRLLLGRLLALDPGSVALQIGPQGKPALDAAHQSDVQFNVAHSHEMALVALARGPALGVDIEYRRELHDALRIARRFFSAQEVAALVAAPVAQQQALFFRIWTRKEAFIKATGRGLSQPLGAFNVMDASGQPLAQVELDGVLTSWRLWDLSPGADYAAALVRPGRGGIALFRYQA